MPPTSTGALATQHRSDCVTSVLMLKWDGRRIGVRSHQSLARGLPQQRYGIPRIKAD